MAAGPLTSAGTPAACSPVSIDQAAQTAALVKTIQYVAAEMPSKRSARKTRTACGTESRQDSMAPNHASISTMAVTLWRRPSLRIPSGFLFHY